MHKNFDIRSMVVGAVLSAGLVLSLAAAATQSGAAGRFQVAVTDGYIVKVDTITGQVWTTFLSRPSQEFLAHDWGK